MIDHDLFQQLMDQVWFRFIMVSVFGFLTGLEFRAYVREANMMHSEEPVVKIGSSRTFTFIAILGYVLFILDSEYRLYLAGMVGLIIFFSLFYYHKLKNGQTGLHQPLISLIVFCYGAVITLMPPWFLVLLFVSIVFTLNARPLSQRLTVNIQPQEISTLAKFLLLSGVILPLLPDYSISPYIPATPFKIWMAVVVISAISYAGYILKKYLLKQQGYLVTGLLGGLYSSTATTVVLARKSRGLVATDASINAGIIAASGMMYLRLLIITMVMNWHLFYYVVVPLLLFGMIAIGFAFFVHRRGIESSKMTPELGKSNPLELGIALLFATLFVIMLAITQQVIANFGSSGLDLLSLGVGFTDIDPFVLSVLSGHFQDMKLQHLAGAIVIAAGSNNLLKAIYAISLGGRKNCGRVALVLFILGLLSIGYGLVLSGGLFGVF